MSFIDSFKKSLGIKGNNKKHSSSGSSDFLDEFSGDDGYYIEPEQSFYEIILIKPKSIDDIDYVVDQVVEENNPVIVDLGYLENEGLEYFQIAGEKIKYLRKEHNAESILFCKDVDKNMIIISPPRVKLVRKE